MPSGVGEYWADQSGQGNHGTQTNGVSMARLVPNVANGLPAMRFDGGDTVRFTTRLTTIRTVFWVVSTAEVAGGASARGACWGTTPRRGRSPGGHGSPGTIWDGGYAAAA